MSDSELTKRFYSSTDEEGRLKTPIGQLEFARSCQIIDRFVSSNAVVLDIGGQQGRIVFGLRSRTMLFIWLIWCLSISRLLLAFRLIRR